jgi:3-oxoacyl-[acyl-carrier protein] reductase
LVWHTRPIPTTTSRPGGGRGSARSRSASSHRRPSAAIATFREQDADYWHYAAAKAGVVAMTKTIARQYGRQSVTAFAVAPGFVDTPFNAPAVAEHGMDLFVNDTALGEVAQPQDVANVIAFLASGKARHATGATVDVNTASYVR